MRERGNRMMIEPSRIVQMAIKLQAVRSQRNIGDVIDEAIMKTFPKDVEESREAIEKLKGEGK